MENYVATKKEYLKTYLNELRILQKKDIVFNGEVVGSKACCLDRGVFIEVELYSKLNNLCIIRTDDKRFIPGKGLVKVSNLFDQENILNGLIKVTNYTLEGTDGIGKSTAIENLLNEGIVCFDRNLDVICKYMLFDVPMEKRIREYKKYLEITKDKILFLVNMDEEEIKRRIYSRNVVSDFDKYAVEYNRMYYDTFNCLKEKGFLNDKLLLLDCTGFTKEEQKEKIKRLVLEHNNA